MGHPRAKIRAWGMAGLLALLLAAPAHALPFDINDVIELDIPGGKVEGDWGH